LAACGGALLVAVGIVVYLVRRDGADEPPSPMAPRAVSLGSVVKRVAAAGDRSPSPPRPGTTAPVSSPKARVASDPGPPQAEGPVLSTAEIVDRCEPSIALIRGRSGNGTGFLVRPGVVATNSHVIREELIPNLEVRFPSAQGAAKGPLPAELLYEDAERDLAFLAVKTSLPPLVVARQFRYRKGEDVTVIGNPGLGQSDVVLENAVSRGVLSIKTTLDGQPFYQLSIAINPGNSGGPVFDARGRVIGVASRKATMEEGVAFCIPLEDLNSALDRLATQPTSAVEEARSGHRMPLTYQLLSSAGACYALGLDVYRKHWEQDPQGSLDLDDAEVKKVRDGLTRLDQQLFANLPAEAGVVAADPRVKESVRHRVDQLAGSYGAMKALFDDPQAAGLPAFRSKLVAMKREHRRLVEETATLLKLNVAEGLLAALSDNNGQDAEVVAQAPGGPARPGMPSFRDRFGIGPPPILHPGFGPFGPPAIPRPGHYSRFARP
jgi:serine protease Do